MCVGVRSLACKKRSFRSCHDLSTFIRHDDGGDWQAGLTASNAMGADEDSPDMSAGRRTDTPTHSRLHGARADSDTADIATQMAGVRISDEPRAAVPSPSQLQHDCCTYIWKLLLVFVPLEGSDVEDQELDISGLLSLRLVSKLFNDSFIMCDGWSLCAKALHTEWFAKDKQMCSLEFAFGHAHSRGVGPLVCSNPADVPAFHQEFHDRINDLKHRTRRVMKVELPTANRRAEASGGKATRITRKEYMCNQQ